MSVRRDYKCILCTKIYSSSQSRSNHMRINHKEKCYISSTETPQSHTETPQFSTQSKYKVPLKKPNFKCSNCMLSFSRSDSLARHIKNNICKINTELQNTDVIKNLQQEIESMKKFQEELMKKIKIHPKTLQKINNQLNNCNINNINNGNIINIIPLGYENLSEILTDKEKLRILNKRCNGLKEIVELVHISNKYSQFNNVYITNLQNTIGYKFDTKTNNFIAVNKSELLDDIIDCRMMDIEMFYNDFENKLDEETTKIIKRFIDRMNNDKDSLKGIKKDEIKLLLYNSRDKIQTKQIEV